MPFLGALWRRMFDEDRVKAAEVDAELDAIEAAEAIVHEAAASDEDDVAGSTPASISHTSSGGVDGAAAGDEAKRSRPWWESRSGARTPRTGFLEDE